MKLRAYRESDSKVICGWITDKKSLYQWSADRIGKFPLDGNALNENYAPMKENKKFIPLTAVDDKEFPVGHLFIRYPDSSDDTVIRFGFVILDPALRGKGEGKKMLQLAIDYAKKNLGITKITLGVFANNDAARYCYEAAGFRAVGQTELYKMEIGEWKCMEMELVVSCDNH